MIHRVMLSTGRSVERTEPSREGSSGKGLYVTTVNVALFAHQMAICSFPVGHTCLEFHNHNNQLIRAVVSIKESLNNHKC